MMTTTQMARFGRDSMGNIEEYYRAYQDKPTPNESDQRQEAMLEELVRRSRNDFGRNLLANLTADGIYDVLKFGITKLFK